LLGASFDSPGLLLLQYRSPIKRSELQQLCMMVK
jgi:hypothetical protein